MISTKKSEKDHDFGRYYSYVVENRLLMLIYAYQIKKEAISFNLFDVKYLLEIFLPLKSKPIRTKVSSCDV